jgi:hypothetical protein
MELFDKVKEIVMTSLLIVYNTNTMGLAICALPSPTDLEQQRLDVEK